MALICKIQGFWAYYLSLAIVLGLIGIAVKVAWIPASIIGFLTMAAAFAEVFKLCNYCN